MTVGASNVNSVTVFPRAPARRRARSCGPKASGSSSPSGRGPADGRSAAPVRRAPAAPADSVRTASTARPPRPHTTSASNLPPPPECRAQTTAHSAQRPRPYETFSTLQPATIRPSSTSAAAPTGNPEYGAYAWRGCLNCLVPQHFQSMSDVMSTSPRPILNAFRSSRSAAEHVTKVTLTSAVFSAPTAKR